MKCDHCDRSAIAKMSKPENEEVYACDTHRSIGKRHWGYEDMQFLRATQRRGTGGMSYKNQSERTLADREERRGLQYSSNPSNV